MKQSMKPHLKNNLQKTMKKYEQYNNKILRKHMKIYYNILKNI